MKRSPSRAFKQTFLAVPAAALMLGVSQAQSTVGLNFQAWYYDSGATPQTVGFGSGYQTTGFPVTARAFGVDPANWYNTDPLPAQASISGPATFNGVGTFAGTLTANLTAPNAWMSGIGEQNDGFNAKPAAIGETVAPGNNEVTWGYLDDGNVTGNAPSVSVSGLAAKFPHGYVIETIAANGGVKSFANVDFTDGATATNTVAYSTYLVAGPDPNADVVQGTVGVSAPSVPFTADTIYINAEPKAANNRSVLAAFIITDQPVVTQDPASSTNDVGAALLLRAGAIGLPPLGYQWRLNGTPLPGATSSAYTNSSLTLTDGGTYDVVVTNLYGAATSAAAAVIVNQKPSQEIDLTSSTNYLTMTRALSYVVGGAQPITYSWTKNGQPLAVTTGTLLLTNLQASDQAAYQVIAANAYGAVTSSVANVTILASLPPYEGFNYAAGDINGQNGGIGWAGAWFQPSSASGGDAVITPGLSFAPSVSSLVTTGAALQTGVNGTPEFDANRLMLGSLGGPNAATVYFSFIGQFTNSGWEVISFLQDSNIQAYVGEGWYNAGWGVGSAGSFPYPEIQETAKLPSTISFVVARFDFTSTNTLVRLYVNPSSLATEPATPDASGVLSTPIQFNGLEIRSHQYPTAGAPCGVLDEFRFGSTWSSIAPYVARTSPAFALQLAAGGVVLDSKPVGTPHDGLNRGTTWLAASTDPNNVTRTGVEQFVETNNSQIGVPADPDFDSTNGTISFWIQYNSTATFPGAGSEAAMLFDRRTSNGTIIALNLDGNIEFQAAHGARFTSTTVNGYVVDGNWHHVAVTYGQSTNDAVTLYVDGAVDTAVTNPAAWSWPTNQEIELGRSHDPYWYVFDGQMDDFRIYNRILTAAEVSTIGTETTSDTLVDTSALKLRFDFNTDSALTGESIVWPYGTLYSSPSLGSDAVWTPVPNALSPQPIVGSGPSLFFQLEGTP